jgi:hypothetical protein
MADGESAQNPADEDSFPELLEFRAAEQKRHKRLIRQVLAASILLLGAGIGVLFLADNDAGLKYIPAGILMVSLGLLGVIRSLISIFTDIDTRDHDMWEGVIGTEEEMLKKHQEDQSGDA